MVSSNLNRFKTSHSRLNHFSLSVHNSLICTIFVKLYGRTIFVDHFSSNYIFEIFFFIKTLAPGRPVFRRENMEMRKNL